MDNTHEAFNTKFLVLIDNVPTDLESQETTVAMKNLEIFSKCRPPEPSPEPVIEPEPVVPTTRRGKTLAWMARALDNETTRIIIKSGGAFAGVAVVAYSTIHRDHVLERQALDQANRSQH